MKMIYKTISGIILVLVIGVLIILYFQYKENNDYEQCGNRLISKIEDFKHKHNRLPNSVLDLGLEEHMDNGPYYEKKDSVNYIIFYNIGFDETKIYYSDIKQWNDIP
jgi:hypothetical protein